ncbi:MAG: hypothetical protein M5R36_24005 [Deltaproteobacteria bacterium]|nr:hypothetical protein [Deltaproteobacteria bacterium]
MKKQLIAAMMIFALAGLGAAGGASAQSTPFEGDVDFITPLALLPLTQYNFTFRVTNTSTPGETTRLIEAVEIYMPSPDYGIFPLDLVAPVALNGGTWDVAAAARDGDNVWVISWNHYGAHPPLDEGGDIGSGEFLDFAFSALTDTSATDGFDWRLMADTGEFDEGTAYVGGDDDDDDDDDDNGDDDIDDDDDTEDGNPFADPDDDNDGFLPSDDEEEGRRLRLLKSGRR